MEVINTLADFLGMSPGLLMVLLVAGIVLVVGWTVLKFVMRVAWKTFSAGCLLLIILIGGLLIGSAMLNNLP